MTPCQPQTTWADDLYPILYYLNFKTPSENTYRGLKINNHNHNNTLTRDYFLLALIAAIKKLIAPSRIINACTWDIV